MTGEFTLSYHYYTQKDERNHFELFLDFDGKSPLETWRHHGRLVEGITKGVRFSSAAPHRREYLRFEGRITQNRGRLRILRRGTFNDCRRLSAVRANSRRQKAKFIKVKL